MKNYIPLSEDIAVSVNVNEIPITVTESAVARKLREVKTWRSRGPDGILNWVLKTFSDILALLIMDIINTSFRSSKVPDIWKLTDVVPLPKVPIVKS